MQKPGTKIKSWAFKASLQMNCMYAVLGEIDMGKLNRQGEPGLAGERHS